MQAVEQWADQKSRVDGYQARRFVNTFVRAHDQQFYFDTNAIIIDTLLDKLVELDAHAKYVLPHSYNNPGYRNRIMKTAVTLHAQGEIDLAGSTKSVFDRVSDELSPPQGRPHGRHEHRAHSGHAVGESGDRFAAHHLEKRRLEEERRRAALGEKPLHWNR